MPAALAGAQASVVRAVLMGLAGLPIHQSSGTSRPLGVLVATLVLMLWVHPAWARSIGFQFSAAATAGMVLTAPALEARLMPCLPPKAQGLAGALAVPLAAMVWTLPCNGFTSAPCPSTPGWPTCWRPPC